MGYGDATIDPGGCCCAPVRGRLTAASAGGFDFVTEEHKAHLQVAFSAHDSPKGPVGHIKLQFEAGTTIHVAVDCLAVDGNLASLEGDVVRRHFDVAEEAVQVIKGLLSEDHFSLTRTFQ